MDFVSHSDPLLRLALLSGLAVFALILLILVAIVLLRIAADRKALRAARIKESWTPVFLNAIEGLPYRLPRVHGRDRELIMLVWLQFSEMLRGAARLRLRDMARELQLAGMAMRLMRRGDMRGRLLGAVSLGRMEAVEARDALAALITDPNPVLSLLAARSLLQIDPAGSAATVLAVVARRVDWSTARVVAMFDEVRDASHGAVLLAALAGSRDADATRLLPLLDAVQTADAWPILAAILKDGKPADTLIAALKAVVDPRALAATRRLAVHAAWPVRAQAATVLGRIGTREDVARLREMLADPEWWVRYRAAGALTQLPFLQRADLLDMAAGLSDRYAAQMLRQVLAETGAECTA
ncbi:MAG: HEAT repeat domain-containing protein [Betaproteobacteria bacterium]|nr:HEAT repeat domain-containing protein [Betaproteobacteria bacterium]